MSAANFIDVQQDRNLHCDKWCERCDSDGEHDLQMYVTSLPKWYPGLRGFRISQCVEALEGACNDVFRSEEESSMLCAFELSAKGVLATTLAEQC